jgi:hypothetical protein
LSTGGEWGRSSAPGEETVKGEEEAVSQLAAAERRWVKRGVGRRETIGNRVRRSPEALSDEGVR